MTNFLWILIKNTNYISIFLSSKLTAENLLNTIEKSIQYIQDSIFTTAFSYGIFQYFIIPFLLVLIFCLVILLIVNRYGFERKLILKRDVEIKINDFLTEIILSDYEAKEINEKIQLFKEQEVPFKRKWCKGIILNKIITIKRNISGVNPNQMLLIYKYFGFHKYSDKLIRSSSWEKKLLGIYHYQILEYKIKTGHIRPNIYVKNKFLKSNALIAVISLSDEKFEFLNQYEKKISTADELKILDIIYQKKSSLPKNINDWIHNKNSSIVTLGIKLMIRYRESLSVNQIEYLLQSASIKVRKETLLAIRTLYIIEASDVLIHYYKTEKVKRNKISALKTMGSIGDNETKDFIASIITEEKDLEIKFEIINSIIKIDKTFFEHYETDDSPESEVINRIILHVNNPHLN
jgi:hypothetical protein